MKASSSPARTTRTRASSGSTARKSSPRREDISSRIAIAAYFKAEARGFAPGHELDDWIAAETEAASWQSH